MHLCKDSPSPFNSFPSHSLESSLLGCSPLYIKGSTDFLHLCASLFMLLIVLFYDKHNRHLQFCLPFLPNSSFHLQYVLPYTNSYTSYYTEFFIWNIVNTLTFFQVELDTTLGLISFQRSSLHQFQYYLASAYSVLVFSSFCFAFSVLLVFLV
jgi:hypothetical protein